MIDNRNFAKIVSCWHLSDADLARLAVDQRIWLAVYGTAHPPVELFTSSHPLGIQDEPPMMEFRD